MPNPSWSIKYCIFSQGPVKVMHGVEVKRENMHILCHFNLLWVLLCKNWELSTLELPS
jgi:hypothetical protein